jgi:phage gpG-like protein
MIKQKIDDSAWNDRIKRLKRNCEDMTKPLDECAEVLVSSIEQNFAAEGRFSEPGSWRGGSSKWQPSGAAKKRGGMTLSDSGQLRASVQKNVQSYKVANGARAEVATNKEYAAVHNFGFDDEVTVKAHKRTLQSGKVVSVREHTRHMKVIATPFMVVQDEDMEEMIDILDMHIMK